MLTALIVKLAQWLINSVFIIWHNNLMELKIDVILQSVVLYCSYGRYEFLSPYFHFQTCCIILPNVSLSNPRERQIRINWKTSQSRQRIKKTPSINTEEGGPDRLNAFSWSVSTGLSERCTIKTMADGTTEEEKLSKRYVYLLLYKLPSCNYTPL